MKNFTIYTIRTFVLLLSFFTAQNLLSQENCGNPGILGPAPSAVSGSTCGFANDYENHCNVTTNDQGPDVVYEYTATKNGCLNFMLNSNNADDFEIGFTILRGGCIGTGSCEVSIDYLDGDFPYNVSVDASAGEKFYIILDTYSSNTYCYNYELTVQDCPPGSNCTDPMEITSLPFSGDFTTCGKGNNIEDLCDGDYMGGEDYMFKFSPSKNTCVSITTNGYPDGNEYFGLFVLDKCPTTPGANCLREDVDFDDVHTIANMYMYQGQDYYIVVDTWPLPDCENFSISITECPETPLGAHCVNPIQIPNVPYNNTNTTCGKGNTFDSSQGHNLCNATFNDEGEDMVYQFVADRNLCLNISTSGWTDPRDGAFTIMDGCPDIPTSNCIFSDEGGGGLFGGGGGPNDAQEIQLLEGDIIYIILDYDAGGCSPVTLNIDTCTNVIPECTNANEAADACANATFICDLSGYCGSTETYTPDRPGNINGAFCGSIENNSWLKFVAGASTVIFDVYTQNCGNNSGVQVLVTETSDCNNFTEIVCYSSAGQAGNTSITANNLVPGNIYYIMIDGFAGDLCDYVLQIKTGIAVPADAGDDRVICGNSIIPLDGTVNPPTSTGYGWSTAGSGTFADASSLTTTYTPSAADVAAGSVTLTLTNPGNTLCPNIKNDDVVFTFKDLELTTTSDTGICLGATVPLVGTTNPSVPATSTPTFSNFDKVGIPDDKNTSAWNGTTGNRSTDWAYSQIDVNCINPNSYILEGVCMNIAHTYVGDLDIFLFNPCGGKIQLFNNSGGNGDNLISTCITGTAAQTIATSGDNAPFSGVYLPQGGAAAWNTFLNGCDPNGTWEIRVNDNRGGDVGTINNWTMTFTTNNYQWSPAVGLDTDIGSSVNATPAATTTYTLTVYDCQSNCTVTSQTTVTVSDMTIALSKTDISCNGADDGSITVNPNNEVGTVLYAVDYGTYQTGNTFNGLTPGKHYITAKDDAGCEKLDSITIVEPTLLTVSANATSECITGNTGVITATAVGGTPGYTYSKDGTTFQANGTFNNLAAGTYTITAKDSRGCEATTTVTLKPNPVADFTVQNITCGSLEADIVTTTSAGNGVFTYTGLGNLTFTGGSAPGDTYKVTADAYGTYDITWTVTLNGCPQDVTKSITLTEEPEANFPTVTPPLCDELSTLFTISSNVGTASFSVNPSAGTSISATGVPNEFQFSAPNYQSYDITLTYTNSMCSDDSTITITFVKEPSPSIPPQPDVCGLTTQLTGTPSIGNILWSAIPSSGVTFDDATIANPNVTVPNYGKYRFVFSEDNGSPCAPVTDTIELEFFEAPLGNAGADPAPFCGTTGITLDGTVSVGVGTWTSGVGIDDANDLKTSVTPTGAGNFTYTLTVTNGVCPAFTDDVTIQVDEKPNTVFPNDTIAVCDLTTSLTGPSSVGTVRWECLDPTAFINSPNSVTTNVTVANYDYYTFSYYDKNGVCPEQTDDIVVNFIEEPVANAGADQAICGKSIQLAAVNSVTGSVGTWSGPGTFTPNENDPNATVTVSTFGAKTYTWTEFVSSTCPTSTDQVTITFEEEPVADAGADDAVCGVIGTVDATPSAGVGTWTWAPTSGATGTLTFSDVNDPDATVTLDTSGVGYNGFGQYTLTWTETNGTQCPSQSDEMIMHFVPASFPDAGIDESICGDTIFLSGVPSFGTGNWSYSGPGILIFEDKTDPNSRVILEPGNEVYGEYSLAWTEISSPCPANSDTTLITFFERPNVEAGVTPDQVCGLKTNLNATASVGEGAWTWKPVGHSGTIAFDDGIPGTHDPQAGITSDTYGTFIFYWAVENGACTPPADSIEYTFYERPTPDADGPSDICAAILPQTFNLDGTTSSGSQWDWTGPAGVTFIPDNLQEDVAVSVNQFGTYKFIFSETNHPVCGVTTDSVIVEVLEQPVANAGIDTTTCGDSYNLDAGITRGKGTGSWRVISTTPNGGLGVSFTDITDSNAVVTITPAPTVRDTAYLEWTVTSGASCNPDVDTVMVIFVAAPNTADAGPDATLCDTLGYQMMATDPGAQTGVWTQVTGPGTSTWRGGDDTSFDAIVDVSTPGIYQFRWTVTAFGCPNGVADFVTLDFREKPQPNAGLNDTVCSLTTNLMASLPIGRSVGNWSRVAGEPGSAIFSDPSSITSNVTVDAAGYGPQSFIWTETNGIIGACASAYRDTVEIVFVETVNPNAGVDSALCADNINLYTDTSLTSAYKDLYTGEWTKVSGPGAVTFTPNAQDPKANVSVSGAFGLYEFKWTETNSVCPQEEDIVEIQFVTPASPNVGPDLDTCDLETGIQVTSSFGRGRWKFIGTGGSTFGNVNATNTFLRVTEYALDTVIWLEDNSPCPNNSDTLLIYFNETPDTEPITPEDVCGTLITMNTTPSISQSQFIGTWSVLDGNLSVSDPNNPTSDFDLNGEPYGEYTLEWRETNGGCPEDFKTVKVNFLETPTPNVGRDTVICGQQMMLYAQKSTGQGIWSYNNISATGALNIASPTNPFSPVTALGYGVYEVIWTETNYGKYTIDCPNADTLYIEFLEIPSPQAVSDFSVCGTTANVTVSNTLPGSTYTWSYTGGNPDVSLSNVSSSPATVDIQNGAFGTHKIQVTELNKGRCAVQDSVNITFIEQPNAAVIPNYDTCGLGARLVAIPSVGTGTWTYNGPNPVTITDPSSPNTTVKVFSQGTYDFVWTEDNNAPCVPSQATLTITFYTIPVADAGPDKNVCGTNALLAATPTIGNGVWTYTGTFSNTFTDATNPTTDVNINPTVSAEYGVYEYVWSETNGGICLSRDTVIITYIEQPIADAGLTDTICDLQYTLDANPSVGQGRWEYFGTPANFGGFDNNINPKATATANVYGTFNFAWIENNSATCPEDTAKITITYAETPTPSVTPVADTCGFTYLLEATPSVGTGQWVLLSNPANASVSFDNEFNPSTRVDVDTEGNYLFAWEETNMICGPIQAQIQVSFYEIPVADIGPDFDNCGLSTTLPGNSSRFNGEWTIIDGPQLAASFNPDVNTHDADITVPEYGTYTLVWTLTNPVGGCDAVTDTVQLAFTENPITNAGNDIFLCGDSTKLDGTASVGDLKWTVLNGPGQLIFSDDKDPKSSIQVANNAYGIYTLELSENNGTGCPVGTDQVIVEFRENPIITAGDDEFYCGLDGILDGLVSVGNVNWTINSSPAGSTVNYANQNADSTAITVSDFGTYRFLISVDNNGACQQSDEVRLNFSEQPVADAGSFDAVCGLTITLGANPSVGEGIWLTDAKGTYSFSNDKNPFSDFTVDDYGVYTLYWIEKNGTACPESRDTVDVEFIEQPVVSIMNDTAICGLTAELKATISAGQGVWTTNAPGAIFSPDNTSPEASVQVNDYNTYDFTWTATTKTPCVPHDTTVTIEFTEFPSTVLTGPTDVCVGDDAVITFDFDGNPLFDVTYTNFTDTFTVVGVDDGHQINITNIQNDVTYRIIDITDGSVANCVSTPGNEHTITAHPLPTATIIGDQTVCEGTNATVNISLTGTAPFTVTLSDGTQIDTSVTSFDYIKTINASEVITITGVTDAYCSGIGSGSAIINMNVSPSVVMGYIGGISQVCDGDQLDIQFDFTPSGNGPWDVTIATNIDTFNVTGITDNEIRALPVKFGSTFIEVISITDGNTPRCSSNNGNTLPITVNPIPQLTFSAPNDYCEGLPFDLSLNFSGVPNFDIAISENGGANTTYRELPSSSDLSLSPTGNTTYTIDTIYDGSNPTCFKYIGQSFTVNEIPQAKVQISLENDSVCQGDSLKIFFALEGIGPFNVFYKNNYGETFSAMSIDDGDFNWVFAPLSQSRLNYTFIVDSIQDASAISCPADLGSFVNLRALELPDVNFAPLSGAGCKPFEIEFRNLTDQFDSEASYWEFSNGPTSDERDPTIVFEESGFYDATLTTVSEFGCTNTKTVTGAIEVYQDPIADFDYLPENPSVSFSEVSFTNLTQGGETYEWRFAELDSTTAENPSYQFPSDDEREYIVCLEATSIEGCINTYCEPVLVKGEVLLYIPNIFTPNGDGINDVFGVSFQGVEASDYELLIFNRWGEVIYSMYDPNAVWDGTINGRKAQIGVYSYKLEYREKYSVERAKVYGSFTLAR